MIQLILFLGVGALLLIALFVLGRRVPKAEGGAEALLEARRALSSLQGELLPPELVARIFAREDLDYITQSTSGDVRELFLAERERIARLWVRQLRRQIVSLRDFHLGSARHYAQLNFRTELSLASEFAVLILACGALDLALKMRGPYGAQHILDTTTAAAARVCEISEKSLGFLRPGTVTPMGNPSARNGATL